MRCGEAVWRIGHSARAVRTPSEPMSCWIWRTYSICGTRTDVQTLWLTSTLMGSSLDTPPISFHWLDSWLQLAFIDVISLGVHILFSNLQIMFEWCIQCGHQKHNDLCVISQEEALCLLCPPKEKNLHHLSHSALFLSGGRKAPGAYGYISVQI